jgi:hypothetical protein
MSPTSPGRMSGPAGEQGYPAQTFWADYTRKSMQTHMRPLAPANSQSLLSSSACRRIEGRLGVWPSNTHLLRWFQTIQAPKRSESSILSWPFLKLFQKMSPTSPGRMSGPAGDQGYPAQTFWADYTRKNTGKSKKERMLVTFGTFLKCHMKETPKLRDIELKLWRVSLLDMIELRVSHFNHYLIG